MLNDVGRFWDYFSRSTPTYVCEMLILGLIGLVLGRYAKKIKRRKREKREIIMQGTVCTPDLSDPKSRAVRPFAKPFAGLRASRLGNYPQASTRNCTRDSSSISTACVRFRGQTHKTLQSFDCVWTEESEKGIGCTRGLYFSLAVQVNSRATGVHVVIIEKQKCVSSTERRQR